MLVGSVVLLGWALDVGDLKSIASNFPAMKANAAIGCILAGVALMLLRSAPQSAGLRVAARACAVAALSIGALTLIEFVFGWGLGIDQLLFHEASGAVGTSSPGRMGANAAVILTLDGLALLLLDVERRGVRPAELLAATSGAIALVALAGYLYGALALTGVGSTTRVSLYAAIAFLSISIGVLVARPDGGVMALVTSPGAGGLTIRRLLVPVVGIPLILGWFCYRGEQAGLYDPQQTLALLVVTTIVAFLALTWFTARSVERADAERTQAEDEIRALAVELEASARRLEGANAELDAFSSSVSHDLRAPLRAINGFSRLLLDEYSGNLPADAQRYLGLIGKNTEDMSTMIDGLLAFSRPGQQQVAKRPVDIDALARRVVLELEQGPELEGREVEISVGALPPAQADPTLLKQVLVNLVDNALKYTRDEDVARIEIGSYEADAVPVYFVRDNGVGFDMRYADKLFQVFQRLHRAEDYEGTGLGLALAARIVKRHGGRIWAEAKPGEGAAFYFTLTGEA